MFREIMLHVKPSGSLGFRPYVTIMDDETLELFSEIVRCGALDRVHYSLDFSTLSPSIVSVLT